MIPQAPNRFPAAHTLDLRRVNENRLQRAADIKRSLAQRYTHSCMVFPLDGVANTSNPGERTITIPAHDNTSDKPLEIVSLELVVFCSDSNVWTLTTTADGWRDITVTGAGDAAEPARTAVELTALVPAAGLSLTLSCSGASTITRGYLVVGIRADRALITGNSHAGYTPNLVGDPDTASASDFNLEFTEEEAAVARDLANDKDGRYEVYVARNITSATASNLKTWRLPATGRRVKSMWAYATGAAAVALGWVLTPPAGIVVTPIVTCTGTSTLDGSGASAVNQTQTTDPFTAASDWTLEPIVSTAGTVLFTYCVVQYE
jgi:hypothetical protein